MSKEIISLCKWMKGESRKHGIRWRCQLYPAHFSDTGRGMMTKSRLYPGDLLVSIPRPLLITVETVLSSEIGEQIRSQNVKFTSQQLLALFLLQEKNKGSNSLWHPYISVLPKTLETFGNFSPREMTLLPPRLQIAVQSRMAIMKQAYLEVRNFLSGERIEYREFLWAWFCVNSRSVFYQSAGSEFVREDGNHLALAPYLDLLNHSVGAQVEAGYNQESGCYEIHTGDMYRKHSQVFISYGNHDNHHLLVEYGFTLPDNPNDVFQVDYDDVLNAALSLGVDYMSKKQEILQQQGFHRKLVCSMEGLSWNLLLVTRILAMNWTELKQWKSVLTGSAVSDRNNTLSRKIAQSFLTKYNKQNQDLITKFHTPLSQSTVERLVFSVVQTERNILQSTWISVT